MYNRYLNAEGFAEYFSPQPEDQPEGQVQAGQQPEISPGRGPQAAPQGGRNLPGSRPPQGQQGQNRRPGLLGGLRLPELDSDTILLLVLVYFLISDSDEDGKKDKNSIVDTLLIVGALLLLGF